MSKRIYLLNGSIIIPETEDTLKLGWLDPHPSKEGFLYFHPNYMTRKLFFRDFLPIKNLFDIDTEVIHYLKTLNLLFDRESLGVVDPAMFKGKQLGTITVDLLEDYQVKAVELMLKKHKLAIFLGPGTGKTMVYAAYLRIRKPRLTLITTVKNAINQVKEEFNILIPEFTIVCKNLEEARKEYKAGKDVILITTVQALHEGFLNPPWVTLIVDESHLSKGFENIYNRSLKIIQKPYTEVYLGSGTPQDKIKFEIISQLSILSDGFINPMGKTAFLQRFFLLDDYGNPKKVRPERDKELSLLINSVSFGYSSEEVLKLPPKHEFIINVQKKSDLYDKLIKDKMLKTSLGVLVADTPSLLRIKSLQILGGHLIIDDDETRVKEVAEIPTNKPQAVIDIVNKEPHAVIYVRFDHEGILIGRELKRLDKKFKRVSTSTTEKRKEDNIKAFKKGEIDYLIINSLSGGTGLNFQYRTNVAIFYTLPDSFVAIDQSEKRVWRKGQVSECRFYYLITEKTFENKLYNTVKVSKKTLSDKMFMTFLKGD
jgi:SNF2 family DNA or RNA helicase